MDEDNINNKCNIWEEFGKNNEGGIAAHSSLDLMEDDSERICFCVQMMEMASALFYSLSKPTRR